MNLGLRNSTSYQKITTRETVSSKMRMKPEQEKLNTWSLAIPTTVSPYLTLTIGSATLREIMNNITSVPWAN